jgi:tetratricopeptide (TPR) repeat protein
VARVNIRSFGGEIHPEYEARTDDAVNSLEMALKLQSPNVFKCYFQMGQAYYYSGQTQKSIAPLRKAYALGIHGQREEIRQFLSEKQLIRAVLGQS